MPEQDLRWLWEIWNRCLKDAVEALTGEPAAVTQVGDPQPADPSTGWWRQRFSYPEQASIWVGADEETSLGLGRRVLKAAGVEEPDAGEARPTYYEVLEQATSATAAALGAKFGREVRALPAEKAAGAAPPGAVRLRIELGQGETFSLWTAFEGFSEEPHAEPEPERPPASSAAPPSSQPIERLLDVELPVSISFGRTQLPLKEVLKLTSGSIVELNRSISDPVEVIVNNCVIARGEVVVVDGNYGVRITEVVSRQQRLGTLG